MNGVVQIGAGMVQRNITTRRNRGHRGGLRCLLEGRMSYRHFVQHNAQGPDIGAIVDRLAGKLLWRHVGKRAHDFVRGGEALLMNEAGKPEVQNFYGAGVQQENVSRLDVSMDNPGHVSGMQPGCGLAADVSDARTLDGAIQD